MRDLSETRSLAPKEADDRLHHLHRDGKPLMEKRRRARINESLSRLKLMVLGEVKRKNTKISKLDKADILEMTVEYVNRIAGNGTQKPQFDKYRAGFNTCADEVRSYLAGRKEIDVEVRTRVIDHLANFIQNLQWLRTTQNQNGKLSNGLINQNITSKLEISTNSNQGFSNTNPYPNMTSHLPVGIPSATFLPPPHESASQTNKTQNNFISSSHISSSLQHPKIESYTIYLNKHHSTSPGSTSSPTSPSIFASSPIFPASPPFVSSAVMQSNNKQLSTSVFVFPEPRLSQENRFANSRREISRHNTSSRDPMWRPW
uniref:Hairy enhancer of split 3 n=1 Tax=Platynereis dumerilii TaxID=6359 RepID=S5TRL2_PLADU|nr:hairy enhancer of split 3 [Platynereis dumerilii]